MNIWASISVCGLYGGRYEYMGCMLGDMNVWVVCRRCEYMAFVVADMNNMGCMLGEINIWVDESMGCMLDDMKK